MPLVIFGFTVLALLVSDCAGNEFRKHDSHIKLSYYGYKHSILKEINNEQGWFSDVEIGETDRFIEMDKTWKIKD